MLLWRLTRAPFVALNGAGAAQFGGRYSSPGRPVVNFASEAGLAVLVALRYLQDGDDAGHVLGWTEIQETPERAPDGPDAQIRVFIDQWLDSRRSRIAAVRSKVLPEADIVLMNPQHPGAALVRPLTIRPFSFIECLHTPPMLDRFGARE